MAEDRKRISVKPGTYTRYETTKEHLGFTGHWSDDGCINMLLDTLTHATVDTSPPVDTPPAVDISPAVDVSPRNIIDLLQCSADEQAEIADALTLEYIDFWTLLKNGFMREVRVHNTQATKLKTLDLDNLRNSQDEPIERDKNRLRGSAYLRVKDCVGRLMRENEAATDPMDVIYITRGIVADTTKTHSSYVTEYFKEHQAELNAHHVALGIGSHHAGIAHNRLRAKQGKMGEKSEKNG